jgi:subtilisin family serine protease
VTGAFVALGSLVVLPGAMPAAAAADSPAGGATVPGRLVVHVDGRHSAADVAQHLGGRLRRSIGGGDYEVEVAAGAEATGVRKARAGDVAGAAWVEPVQKFTVADEPNDPCYVRGCVGSDEYALRKVNASQAWSITTGSAAVKVAVLDTGVDDTHSELAGKVTQGPNYTSSPAADSYGHGTEVSGVIAGRTNNNYFMASLGWNTSILAVKVLDDTGSGDSVSIAQGIRWATDNGAQVINMSLSGPSASSAVSNAVAYAISHNVVVVAAAGNDSSSVPTYPASYPGVISVAATDRNDNLANYSNRGPWVTMAAPGSGILTISPGEKYAVVSGTSFAAPEVAAAAALVLAARPGASVAETTARLTTGSDTLASLAGSVLTGRLNAGRAVSGGLGGYEMVASDGGVFSFGDAGFYGSTGAIHLNSPIVGMAATPSGRGYWLVASDGGIFAFGDAGFYGSTGAIHLNSPIVGMAATPSGRGYWLVASDGGIFAFGDAPFRGSTGDIRLNQPIVGMAASASGAGYWLVARDGGIFAFGDAPFLGSTGAIHLNQPIVGMAASPSGGYWLVASDGGIFAFGAPFLGSTGAIKLNKPIVGMSAAKSGGYRLVASDGGIFAFGGAPFLGSTGGISLNRPVVALATA